MKDVLGNDLKVGDIVLLATTSSSYCAQLVKRKIVGFKNHAGYECAKMVPTDIDDNDKRSYYWNAYPDVHSGKKIVKIAE